MSCYEWERGTISIPAKEWSGFRKALITSWNEHQDAVLAVAKEAYRGLKDSDKGEIRQDHAPVMNWLEKNRPNMDSSLMREVCDAVAEPVMQETERPSWDGKTIVKEKRFAGYKLRLPTKESVKYFSLTAGCVMQLDGATITLNEDNKTVTWSVEENNRACEYARRNQIARKLFQLLAQIKWTRGSGGVIVGNDEYNRDNTYSGGGGNYTKSTYGPAPSTKKTPGRGKETIAEREARFREHMRWSR